MDRKLAEISRGQEANRILPFFWLHGDDREKFASELDRIEEAGIHAVCLESRPHPDFCGDGWWGDLDLIMDEAKKRGMKVWVLDDKHYPTGIANGMIAKKYPELRKWHMIENHVDVTGPRSGALLLHIDDEAAVTRDRQLLAAVAYRRTGPEEKMAGEAIDLTANVKGDLLYWNVPEGCWRVYMISISREGAAGHMADYIHLIDPESVDVLINEVYKPHFDHYGAEFGNTFAGFFSDEPALGNSFLRGMPIGGYDYKIGLQLLALPWRQDMPEMLEAKLGPDWKLLLPGLWREVEGVTAKVRLAYMDILTGLYRDCFCRRIGDWCRAHGVEYIGHVIEDMNCHARMGAGTGHYFRALEGQDMAGIDVVLHQIIPEMGHYDHNSTAGYGCVDTTFYNYALAKLGSSLAYLKPHMRGRTMCEVFGAYGWAEGVPMMKWLIDHLLVRGVNHFVPHAFDTHFPCKDCPPHFYARGNNPQFRDFGTLMRYTNRVSHLFTDGTPVLSAGIFYHAETEWTGDRYSYSQVPAKALYDAQLDYMFVPADALLTAELNARGELVLGTVSVPCLIIPEAGTLPAKVLAKLTELSEAGFPVAFTDSEPERTENGAVKIADSLKTVPLADLPAFVRSAAGERAVNIAPAFPLLRVFHYTRGGNDYFMLFNEDMRAFRGTVSLPLAADMSGARLDLLNLTYRRLPGKVFPLELARGESCILAFGADIEAEICGEGSLLREEAAEIPADAVKRTIALETFRISRCAAAEYPAFSAEKSAKPYDLTGPEGDQTFCGYARYETEFTAGPDETRGEIRLGEVGETAHVWLNGKYIGSRICKPYRLRLDGALKAGVNELRIEVANSVAYSRRDRFSKELMLPASGLLGPSEVELAK